MEEDIPPMSLLLISLRKVCFGTLAWSCVVSSVAPSIANDPPVAIANTELLSVLHVPGNTRDQSGLTEQTETGIAFDQFGGISGIDYTGQGQDFWVLADRGPADGAVTFPCRFHRVRFEWADGIPRGLKIVDTRLLRDSQNKVYTGSLNGLRNWDGRGHTPVYDPEGLRVFSPNQLVLSDEYGPSIDIVSTDGTLQSSIEVPEAFRLSELRKPPFERGAYSNRGFEGIAVAPDRSFGIAALQGPLVQDGRILNNKCLGLNTRWLVWSSVASKHRELVYRLEDESTGVSEILAVDASRFLVLERDSNKGQAAKYKRIYLCSIEGATDVSSVASLPSELPNTIRPVQKSLWIDLLDPKYGLNGENAPEKPEGIAWGPDLPDGRRMLVVCFDNDFQSDVDALFAIFAISKDNGR